MHLGTNKPVSDCVVIQFGGISDPRAAVDCFVDVFARVRKDNTPIANQLASILSNSQ